MSERRFEAEELAPLRAFWSEAVRQAVEATGAVAVTDPTRADAAVINSCTVTHVAEAKLRALVRRLARRRRRLRRDVGHVMS